MSYFPPLSPRRRFGGSPGQIGLVVVLVVLALIIYSRTGDPSVLAGSAVRLLFLFPALILSLSIHEACHAATAAALGDDLARRQGRLTLDPRAHLDPLGTLMLVMTVLIGFGIGWAKPVPVNPGRLIIGPRLGMAVVAIAGPISNLVIAFTAIRLAMLLEPTSLPTAVIGFLEVLAQLNVFLAVFNMIPIPPLDGYRVLVGILPEPMANPLAMLEPYGPMILLFVVFMGGGLVGGIVAGLSRPILSFMFNPFGLTAANLGVAALASLGPFRRWRG